GNGDAGGTPLSRAAVLVLPRAAELRGGAARGRAGRAGGAGILRDAGREPGQWLSLLGPRRGAEGAGRFGGRRGSPGDVAAGLDRGAGGGTRGALPALAAGRRASPAGAGLGTSCTFRWARHPSDFARFTCTGPRETLLNPDRFL